MSDEIKWPKCKIHGIKGHMAWSPACSRMSGIPHTHEPKLPTIKAAVDSDNDSGNYYDNFVDGRGF